MIYFQIIIRNFNWSPRASLPVTPRAVITSLPTSLSISNTLCLHFIKDWCTGLQMGAVSAKQSPAALASLPAESMKNTSPDASNCQNREEETFVMPAFFWSKGSRSYQLELLNIGLMWWMPGMKQFTIETHWKRLTLVYNWLLWVWQTHWKFKATIFSRKLSSIEIWCCEKKSFLL